MNWTACRTMKSRKFQKDPKLDTTATKQLALAWDFTANATTTCVRGNFEMSGFTNHQSISGIINGYNSYIDVFPLNFSWQLRVCGSAS